MAECHPIWERQQVAVIVCPEPHRLKELAPDIVVDTVIAKRNSGINRELAQRVVGVGPGFTAGDNVRCVIETSRGPNLGRCLWSGTVERNTRLSGELEGESVKRITDSYPHWFTPAYAAFAGREEDLPIDQHMLIALAAPRPVLLGNAKRDVWSDPQGAFRAAQGADPVYEMFGSRGLDQATLSGLDVTADITFYMRGGRHGVTAQDWRTFLDFADAHGLARPGPPGSTQAAQRTDRSTGERQRR